MTMIVTAVYELMGKFAEQVMQDNTVSAKVDSLFQVKICLVWLLILLMYVCTDVN